jgi:transcriptional regulator with XRE-family HTH domain
MTMDDPTPSTTPALPEQRIGAALRAARETGGLSLRAVAKRLGYNSHTTLSSYERGSIMPPEVVVEGYEKLLGLPEGKLMKVLEAACVERHGDAWAKRRSHLPTRPTAPEAEPVPSSAVQGRLDWYRRRRFILSAGLVIVLIAVGGALWVSHRGDGGPDFVVPGQLDMADPETTGCVGKVEHADEVSVHDPPQHLAGKLQLRFSPLCGTSWARFEPSGGLATTPPIVIEVNLRRPADGAVAPFSVAYDGLPAYGNMLVSSHQCVVAELVIHRGNSASPTFRTACRRGAG